jgi:hypothetical protein
MSFDIIQATLVETEELGLTTNPVNTAYITNINGAPVSALSILPYESIHQFISPTTFGYSPSLPGLTNKYLNAYGNWPIYWVSCDTAPTVYPPMFTSPPINNCNYGTVLSTLPPGDFLVSFNLLQSPGGGIATITINGTTYTEDLYTADTNNLNAAYSFPVTIPSQTMNNLSINLQCLGKNGESSGYAVAMTDGVYIDAINTTTP